MAGQVAAFTVGDTFISYKELEDRLKSYERSQSIQLCHRDSRTLDAARKRAPKKVERAKKELIYYSIYLACVFGGKKYKSKSTGQRPEQLTFKQGCNAGIKLILSEDGQHLKVTEITEEHNHEISKVDVYEHLPRQRRLDKGERKEAEDMLRMKVNKKLLQQHLSEVTGKIVTLKDLTNIQTGLASQCDGNDVKALLNRLEGMEGSTVNVFTDETKTLTGLFFQDSLMKSVYAAYPEVLLVDATYKLVDLRMPVYLMLSIDGNGQSEIVSVFLTALETEEAITKMVQALKASNPAWSSTQVVITDKDFTERVVFRKEFPQAALLICLFHAMRSFKREITCDKLGLHPGERDHALEVITKLAYARSEAEYDEHYLALLKSCPKSVIQYYNSNWHPIRHEWVECFKGFSFTLGEKTNNRLESINGKVKSVCSRYVSLSKFFEQFFAVLSSLRNERDHATLMAMVKKRVTTIPKDSAEEQYEQLLTPYACKFVSKQMQLRNKVSINSEAGSECTILSSEGTLTVTAETCHCKFSTTMCLPCRHVFAVREHKQLPLFSTEGVAGRWLMKYLQHVFDRKKTVVAPASFQVSSIATERARTVLTAHQKYREAEKVVRNLPSLASEVGMTVFEGRLALLKDLQDIWAGGGTAILQRADSWQMEGQLPMDDAGSTQTPGCSSSSHQHTTQTVEQDGSDEIHSSEGQESTLCLHQHTAQEQESTDEHHSSETTTQHGSQHSLDEIRLPSKIRKRGRHKGAEKTVIGLPKKKHKGNKPIPFCKKQPSNKDKVILQWFVDSEVAEAAVAGEIIDEDKVEVRPERVSASCLDKYVCLNSCRKYFSRDGWCAVESVVDVIRRHPVWYCGRCTNPICDEEESSVVCDCCLLWYHFDCVGLKQSPKSRVWLSFMLFCFIVFTVIMTL